MKLLFFLTVLAALFASIVARNEQPIIGIFTEHLNSDDFSPYTEYIAASYVRWVEQAGGRVVPIPLHSTEEELDRFFESVNGLLFPGGGEDLKFNSTRRLRNAFTESERYVFHKAMKINEMGTVFPIWGTCLGFESMMMLASNDDRILDLSGPFNAWNLRYPLHFQIDPQMTKMFSNASSQMISNLENKRLTSNYHHYGVAPSVWNSYPAASQWNVISTNKDEDGKDFISSVENKLHPFFATQWHPEKPQFEFAVHHDIIHTQDAVQVGQFLANRFVGYARQNDHKFPSKDMEKAALIYNFPVLPSEDKFGFMEIYVF
eukprot:TRINITY_DN591_c0_g9_i1.p1 TRINITY_DN591_c0_g9~~TRINITY_DN591_c0_g9_i1.p1  ORF type:complete len:318 (+),score=88.63 TRINITY_DN591_c0_g9_i1:83-1036(+)